LAKLAQRGWFHEHFPLNNSSDEYDAGILLYVLKGKQHDQCVAH